MSASGSRWWRSASVVVVMLSATATGCSSGSGSGSGSARADVTTSPTSTAPSASTLPGAGDRVVVRGDATLDGARFDSRWVGAVVLRSGLVTPCQSALPPIANGRYAVTVLAGTESSGCGAPGARIVLWTFAHDKLVYSTNAMPWPGTNHTVEFAATYSSSGPAGAAPSIAQFSGGVRAGDGRPLPPGARVDAYVGDTRCGTASVRSTPDFTGYVLAVVGPDSITGCRRGATLTFRVDGRRATGARVVNTPPGRQETLDLTVS